VKQVLMAGETEENSPTWNIGINPALFPYTLRFGSANQMRQQLQIVVPIDDVTTWHITYDVYVPPEGVSYPQQDGPAIPYVEVPLKDENGEFILDYVIAQDMVAWYSQGEITDRSVEHLATTDAVVIGMRNQLREQIELVQRGGEPLNVFRDTEKNQCINFNLAERRGSAGNYRTRYHVGSYMNDDLERYSPDIDVIKDLMRQASELAPQS
jgi:5,5'-dehydrodivanillate O-demethylase